VARRNGAPGGGTASPASAAGIVSARAAAPRSRPSNARRSSATGSVKSSWLLAWERPPALAASDAFTSTSFLMRRLRI
jgi:hypothetical protein